MLGCAYNMDDGEMSKQQLSDETEGGKFYGSLGV